MPEFRIKFKNETTGRVNSKKLRAFDEQALLRGLAEDGIVPDQVERVEEPRASERQLAWLADIGHRFGPDEVPTQAEASDLISNFQYKQTPAEPRVHAIAAEFEIEFTRYASKDRIYRRLTSELLISRRLADLAAWFVFRVYRTNCDRSKQMIDGARSPAFIEVGSLLLSDAAAEKSLTRAARDTVTGFRWFGEFVSPDGASHTGDSKRTHSYQIALSELRKRGLIKGDQPVQPKVQVTAPASFPRGNYPEDTVVRTPSSASSGCLGSFVFLALTLGGLALLSLHAGLSI